MVVRIFIQWCTDSTWISEITTRLLLNNIERVFILARNKNKFEESRKKWPHRTGLSLDVIDKKLEFIQCELADIRSVKGAAEHIKRKIDRVHILICNAGMDSLLRISTLKI